MIYLLTGAPGSGKTYFAVWTIRNILERDDVIVCSNIDGLTQARLRENGIKNYQNYINIDRDLSDTFFVYGNFKKFCSRIRKAKGDKRIIFFIDEAQRWLGVKKRLSQETVYTFDYHRHLGVDFYLVTQHSRKIHFDISCLAEYEIRAQRQKLNLLNRFKYFFLVDNFVFQKKTLPKKPEVFALYRSFEVPSSGASERSALLRYVVAAFLLFLFAASGYFWFRHSFSSLAYSKRLSLKHSNSKHSHSKRLAVKHSHSSSPTFVLLPDNSLLICEAGDCASYPPTKPVRYKGFVFSNPRSFCDYFHCL